MFSLNMFQSVLVWAELQTIAADPYTSGRRQATLYNGTLINAKFV